MNNRIMGSLRIPLLAGLLLAAAPTAGAAIYIRIQPPDVRVENYQERRGYVWQSGYWRWRGQQHVWTPGHYARQKRGQRWTNGRWDRHERGYFWTGGRWESERQDQREDRRR